jgi:hypothetical protein
MASLAVNSVEANVGPKTTLTLIERSQASNNVKGSSLELTYWVYTYDDPEEEDVGIAVINQETLLTMNGVEDGADVYFCALVLKVAGT